MKIYVDKIHNEGLEIEEQLDPKKMSLDLDEQYINFVESIDVKAYVTKTDRNVFVDLNLEAPCEYTCSRCLTKIQDTFKRKFNINYDVKPGDIIEIDEDIRQEIILDCPMKVVCKENCKGLCPNCGQNLNVMQCECGEKVT